jgi:hypothetical protein
VSEPRKRATKVSRELKYSAPGSDLFRRLLGEEDDGGGGEGGAGVREPRPVRPRGPGPEAIALDQEDAAEKAAALVRVGRQR